MLKEKVEAIKQHVKDHKEAYIVGAVCLVVGSAGTLYFAKRHPVLISNKEIMNIKYQSPTTNIAQIILPALGDPGNVVQEIETGLFYPSQGDYARKNGVSITHVSDHLHGKTPDLKGKHLRVVGKAGHPIDTANL